MSTSSIGKLLLSCVLTLGALRLYPDIRFISVYATFLGLAPFYFMKRKQASASADPYGSFHLRLNGGKKGALPKTEWLNMGYWKDTSSFPEACETLAMRLVRTSQMKPGAVVLDVGHGTGESIINLLSNNAVPRPSHVTGITSLLSHAQRTAERAKTLTVTTDVPSSSGSPSLKVTIVHGDAVYNPKLHDPTSAFGGVHPFSPLFPAQSFDTIFALDCAYHFRTRRAFLSQAFDKLSVNGRIALADICFVDGQSNKIATLWAWMIGIPRENMINADEYETMLEDIGYVDVEVEDVTKDVFPGFLAFLRTQGVRWVIVAEIMEKVASSGARYVVVGARKGQSAEQELKRTR